MVCGKEAHAGQVTNAATLIVPLKFHRPIYKDVLGSPNSCFLGVGWGGVGVWVWDIPCSPTLVLATLDQWQSPTGCHFYMAQVHFQREAYFKMQFDITLMPKYNYFYAVA